MRLVHILNPVSLSKDQELYHTQAFVFESLRRSRDHYTGSGRITHVSVHYEEDRPFIPKFFHQRPPLKHSIQDLLPKVGGGKKLPLLREVLERGTEIKSDYYLYTNADIILQPHFYDFIFRKIEEGYDGLIINRRRIPFFIDKTLDELCHYALIKGKSHPGFDCFLMSRDLLPLFELSVICLGIPFIGVTLAHNLFAFSKRLGYYDRENLTFHLGMRIRHKAAEAYYWHNRNSFFQEIKPKLDPYFDIHKFPYASLPLIKRYSKWIQNPSLFTLMNLKMEILRKWNIRKVKSIS
ncbi:MAG: hypothetical protein OXB93_05455 [Cytophagales bacterium]|nr:hypothetical protein [Cytophagales bacterium]